MYICGAKLWIVRSGDKFRKRTSPSLVSIIWCFRLYLFWVLLGLWFHIFHCGMEYIFSLSLVITNKVNYFQWN